MPSKEQLAEIKRLISTPRLGTYLSVSPDELSAIELYAWNARLSGVLLPAFHMCEVGLRNSVSEALSKVYGERWPWNNGFRRSLPASKKGYSQKDDLIHKAAKENSTGKVIPELNFVFWEKMFDTRHYESLWHQHLWDVMRGIPPSECARGSDYGKRYLVDHVKPRIESVRSLRDRVAHHEPIFFWHIPAYFEGLLELVKYCSPELHQWVRTEYEDDFRRVYDGVPGFLPTPTKVPKFPLLADPPI